MLLNYKNKLNLLSIITLSVIMFSMLLDISYAEINNVIIYGPSDIPHGISYGELAQMHWNSHINLNSTQSPASESYNHQKCFFSEMNNMIFLQDFYAEVPINRDRSFECTIPQLPVVIPALTEGCSFGDFQNKEERNDNKLIECVNSHNPYAIVEVTIDGKQVTKINDYRKTSEFFVLNVTNPQNEYGIEFGNWRALIDAIMIVVDFPVGEHTINYKVNQKLPAIIAPDDPPLKTNINYHLIVKPDN